MSVTVGFFYGVFSLYVGFGKNAEGNFDKLMTQETGVPAHVAEDALYCVVKGTGVVLENIELWKRTVTTKR